MIANHHRMAGVIALALCLTATGVASAMQQQSGADDDCYNRVTRECNKKYPDGDWGDANYRQCINDGLDKCDADEPADITRSPGTLAPGWGKVAPPPGSRDVMKFKPFKLNNRTFWLKQQ